MSVRECDHSNSLIENYGSLDISMLQGLRETVLSLMGTEGNNESNAIAITSASASVLLERLKDIDKKIEIKNEKISKASNEYREKMILAFEEAKQKDEADLLQRQRLEGIAGLSGALTGGSIAYSFTNGVSNLISYTTGGIVNTVMRRIVEMTSFAGYSLFECGSRVNEGWYGEYKESAYMGNYLTCSDWEGININNYGNITTASTTAGIIIGCLAFLVGAKVVRGQSSLIQPGILHNAVSGASAIITFGTSTLVQALLPSRERRLLEKRIQEGRHFAGSHGELVTKGELLQHLTRDFEKSLQFITQKEELEKLNGERKQLQSELIKLTGIAANFERERAIMKQEQRHELALCAMDVIKASTLTRSEVIKRKI
jgi:hypothetical protein